MLWKIQSKGCSCDDTAAAVLDENGRILSHVVSSQWDILHLWKGVVPNLAARAHGQNLPKVVSRAIQERLEMLYSCINDREITFACLADYLALINSMPLRSQRGLVWQCV